MYKTRILLAFTLTLACLVIISMVTVALNPKLRLIALAMSPQPTAQDIMET